MKTDYIVYFVKYNDEIVYIGSGKKGRESHVNSGSSHNALLNKHYFTIGPMDVSIVYDNLTKKQSLEKELIAINARSPKYNVKKRNCGADKPIDMRTGGFGWLNKTSKPTIVPKDNFDLEKLVREEMEKYGNNCDLNHIDVSNITNMSYLFNNCKFNGDISNWNVSRVKYMQGMFEDSSFNGDISNWNVSKVKYMQEMFKKSQFNGDISKWDVSNVESMNNMFTLSKFTNDISEWKPFKLERMSGMFDRTPNPVPYWATYPDIETRKKAIDSYCLSKDLNNELNKNLNSNKRIKL